MCTDCIVHVRNIAARILALRGAECTILGFFVFSLIARHFQKRESLFDVQKGIHGEGLALPGKAESFLGHGAALHVAVLDQKHVIAIVDALFDRNFGAIVNDLLHGPGVHEAVVLASLAHLREVARVLVDLLVLEEDVLDLELLRPHVFGHVREEHVAGVQQEALVVLRHRHLEADLLCDRHVEVL